MCVYIFIYMTIFDSVRLVTVLCLLHHVFHCCFHNYLTIGITILCSIAEVDKQKLSHALKILSETEKQLRMSKHQTTWLTVALLQLSSVESSSLDLSDSKLSQRNAHEKGHKTHHHC